MFHFYFQLATMPVLLVLLLVLLQIRLGKPDFYLGEEQVEDVKDSYNRESNTTCAYK
jgi:hypothetical protein